MKKVQIGVNCGGEEYTDSKGRQFSKDVPYQKSIGYGYLGGKEAKGRFPLKGKHRSEVFYTERWGFKEYRFDLQPGVYQVDLFFVESHFSQPLERVFDVEIEGKTVLADLDLTAEYGKYTGVIKSFIVKLRDSQLNLRVMASRDQPKLCAVYIATLEKKDTGLEPPKITTVSNRQNQVGLEWELEKNPFVDGYQLYRSENRDGPWEKVKPELIREKYYVDTGLENRKKYYYRVQAVDVFGSQSDMSGVAEAFPGEVAADSFSINLNCGGSGFVDEQDRNYLGDTLYNPGKGYGFCGGTSERNAHPGLPFEAMSYQKGVREYTFDLPNGMYQVSLLFAEPEHKRKGKRIFDVFIEKRRVLEKLDLFEKRGKKAILTEFTTRVTDGQLNIALEQVTGEPILSAITVQALKAVPAVPEAVRNSKVIPRGDRVFITWEPANSDVIGYNIYRSDDGKKGRRKLNDSLIGTEVFRDNDVQTGKTYTYMVTAVNAALKEGAEVVTEPVKVHKLTDEDLLDMIQKAAFLFFWEQADQYTGLIKDNSTKDYVSAAATGFGLSAMIVGVERGYKERTRIEQRVLRMLKCLNASPRKYGIFYHFLDFDGKPTLRGYENIASSIDSALLFMGVITVAEYFDGEIRSEAEKLIQNANWRAFANPQNNEIYMSWKPAVPSQVSGNGNFEPATWNYYTDESIICTLLGTAAPNPEYRLPASAFYRWKRENGSYKPLTSGYQTAGPFVYSWPGALFTYQFAHCWVDFKTLGADDPKNTGQKGVPAINWFQNSVEASKAARLYCIDRRKKFKTFGKNSWGLTACAAKCGYFVGGGLPRGEAGEHPGDGTIAPYGAGSSILFTSKESMAALWHYYHLKDKNGKRLVWCDEFEGGYGFWDSFNLDTGYVAKELIGIDQGPLILAIENYRTGLIHRYFMKNKDIQAALKRIGFENL